MGLGTIKSKDELVSHLNAKFPGLGYRVTGASEPQVIGSSTGGYSTLQFVNGKPVINKLTDPVENPFSNQVLLTKTGPTGEVTKQFVDKSLLKDPVVTKEEQLSKTKKETMFIQMLEGLHADDAKLMIAVKEKELNTVYKGLTDAVVKEAFGWNSDYKTS